MSSNTRTISITTSAAEFLHSILNSQKAKSKPEINKLRAAFAVFVPVRKAYQDKSTALRNSLREEREQKDANGNVSIGYVIPEARVDEFNEKTKLLQEEKVSLTFDRETMSFIKTIVDGIFDRPELKDGINNETQVTLYNEVSTAIDEAVAGKVGDGEDGSKA